MIKHLPAYLALSIALTPFALADGLDEDVQKIQKQGSPKVLRCVLNKRPRCLAIQLSDQLAIAYDTWRGGLVMAWQPADPEKPFKLDGAVFTGRHGPQPTANGKGYFAEPQGKEARYAVANRKSKLRYLGHRLAGAKGNQWVVLSFSLEDETGKSLAKIEDTCAVQKNTLHRKITVTGLVDGAELIVRFPQNSQWRGVTDNQVVIKKNGNQTFTTELR